MYERQGALLFIHDEVIVSTDALKMLGTGRFPESPAIKIDFAFNNRWFKKERDV